jgi:homogentisate 1,2-dioxygenase
MSLVRDFLAQKDGDFQQYVPAAYKLNPDEKARLLAVQNLRTKFELSQAGKCMKPCFKNFKTAVVSENESECMTNCVAKSLEGLSLMQLQFARSQ